MRCSRVPSWGVFIHLFRGPPPQQVAAFMLVGPREDTVMITLDDDCHYREDLVESLVTHLPADGGAVGGFCEEPTTRCGT